MSGLIFLPSGRKMFMNLQAGRRRPCAHEGDDAHGEDAERHRAEEGLCLRRSADGDAEENDDDVHELVLRGLGQTVDHAALTEQVAEHQAADQRSCARNEQSDERGDGNRENDLFLLGNRTQGVHGGSCAPSSWSGRA